MVFWLAVLDRVPGSGALLLLALPIAFVAALLFRPLSSLAFARPVVKVRQVSSLYAIRWTN
jgi:hypothetical protein